MKRGIWFSAACDRRRDIFFEKNQCRRGIRGLLAAFWLKGGKGEEERCQAKLSVSWLLTVISRILYLPPRRRKKRRKIGQSAEKLSASHTASIHFNQGLIAVSLLMNREGIFSSLHEFFPRRNIFFPPHNNVQDIFLFWPEGYFQDVKLIYRGIFPTKL